MAVVFDASALLAMTFREPGASRVEGALGDGVLSSVNASEVVARLIDHGWSDANARGSLRAFRLPIRPFDEALAVEAGLLRRTTREQGLSLGDRACLALARRERALVLTADRAWTALELDVEVELIR